VRTIIIIYRSRTIIIYRSRYLPSRLPWYIRCYSISFTTTQLTLSTASQSQVWHVRQAHAQYTRAYAVRYVVVYGHRSCNAVRIPLRTIIRYYAWLGIVLCNFESLLAGRTRHCYAILCRSGNALIRCKWNMEYFVKCLPNFMQYIQINI